MVTQDGGPLANSPVNGRARPQGLSPPPLPSSKPDAPAGHGRKPCDDDEPEAATGHHSILSGTRVPAAAHRSPFCPRPLGMGLGAGPTGCPPACTASTNGTPDRDPGYASPVARRRRPARSARVPIEQGPRATDAVATLRRSAWHPRPHDPSTPGTSLARPSTSMPDRSRPGRKDDEEATTLSSPGDDDLWVGRPPSHAPRAPPTAATARGPIIGRPIDPAKAVAVPGTYFGFYRWPSAPSDLPTPVELLAPRSPRHRWVLFTIVCSLVILCLMLWELVGAR